MAIAKRDDRFRACVHGVNDSEFGHRIALSQVSKAVNFIMTKDGELESRGGSVRKSDTTVGASTNVTYIHEFHEREADGTISRTFLIKAGTTLYSFNATTNVFDTVQASLSTNKPSMVNFISTAGDEVVLYADGENFAMWDGTTWTDIFGNFNAATGRDKPRYLWVDHSVCWAAGDDANPDKIFYSDPLKPDTNWGANSYLTVEGGLEKITGLHRIYDYPVVATTDKIYIITGRVDGDFVALRVSPDAGCTSHWSIVSDGSFLYWFHGKTIYIGKLRAAEQDGMDVEVISSNVERTLATLADDALDEVEGIFHEDKGQIYWSLRTGTETNPDKLLVYSTWRSTPLAPFTQYGPDLRFVWGGYHEGLDYNAVGLVKDSNGIEGVYVGGSDGLVRELFSGYKDDRDRTAASTVGTDYESEIQTREETFGVVGTSVRVRKMLPVFYQKYNGAVTFQYVVDRSKIYPTVAKSVLFKGNIPYWHAAGTSGYTSLWNSTIWTKKPVLSAQVNVGKIAHSIHYIIKLPGTNNRDEMSWVGYSNIYQALPSSRGKSS